MIAVDTNILVYAHREDCKWHETASEKLAGLAEGPAQWAIPWSCLHEFISIVTHPKIWRPPTPMKLAFEQIECWLESPTVNILRESPGHLVTLRTLALNARIAGPQIHDTRIAAICIGQGVAELWSADRDFQRYPGLRVRNPLLVGHH